jgi:hypothetical protein
MSLLLLQEKRLHSAGVGGPATVHLSIYAIFLVFLDLVILTRTSTRRSEIPATALDVFTVKADPSMG